MHRLSSDRTYGLLMLAVILSIGLYTAYDAQASMMQPGWFAGLRAGVWCRNVVHLPEGGTATFFHYPGKSLERVTKELGVPEPLRSLYLDSDNRRDILCFDTWQASALANATFQIVTKDYGAVLADWTEQDYQRAVLMLNLQNDGMARLIEVMKLQQRNLEQSRQQ